MGFEIEYDLQSVDLASLSIYASPTSPDEIVVETALSIHHSQNGAAELGLRSFEVVMEFHSCEGKLVECAWEPMATPRTESTEKKTKIRGKIGVKVAEAEAESETLERGESGAAIATKVCQANRRQGKTVSFKFYNGKLLWGTGRAVVKLQGISAESDGVIRVRTPPRQFFSAATGGGILSALAQLLSGARLRVAGQIPALSAKVHVKKGA